jgi:CRISPR-associated endonuclease/helicase Cas3
MTQSEKGNKPFIIPDRAYDMEKGLMLKNIKEENLDSKYQVL